VHIRTCATYRHLSHLLAPFSDKSRVAPHVVGMLLTVVAHVLSTGSVLFLLMGIDAAEIVRVFASPFPVGFLLLLTTTFRIATGLLPSLEPRVRVVPAAAERASSPREHTYSPLANIFSTNRPKRRANPAGNNVASLRGKVPKTRDTEQKLHISKVSTFVQKCYA